MPKAKKSKAGSSLYKDFDVSVFKWRGHARSLSCHDGSTETKDQAGQGKESSAIECDQYILQGKVHCPDTAEHHQGQVRSTNFEAQPHR